MDSAPEHTSFRERTVRPLPHRDMEPPSYSPGSSRRPIGGLPRCANCGEADEFMAESSVCDKCGETVCWICTFQSGPYGDDDGTYNKLCGDCFTPIGRREHGSR